PTCVPADVELEIGGRTYIVNEILRGETIIIRARICEHDARVAAQAEHVCAWRQLTRARNDLHVVGRRVFVFSSCLRLTDYCADCDERADEKRVMDWSSC